MNISKKLFAGLLTLSLVSGSFCVMADAETTPGYKLVNTYDEEAGVITSDLYVTDGYGMVGQLGFYYDTKALSLAANVGGALTADYDDISELKISNFVTGVSASDFTVVPAAETNSIQNLVNEENGEFFFAWYADTTSIVDARSKNQKIATVKFIVEDGYDANDLEEIGTDLIKFATKKPSNESVKGYASGVYCANEENTAFTNSNTAKNKITTSVEFVGIDIEEETEIVTIKVVYADGKPVKGAIVKIGSQQVTTDENGDATFEVSGTYTVYYKYSKNDTFVALDSDKTTAKITPPAKLSAPTLTKGVEQIKVSWSKPSYTGGSDVTEYVVSYTKAGGSEVTKTVGASKTSITLTGLTGNTTYSIKVKAVNAIGDGEYSSVKTATPTKSNDGGGSTVGNTGGNVGGGDAPVITNYVVTYDVAANGTITSGSKTEAVKPGSKPVNVPTVKANDGYKFLGWAKAGGSIIDPRNVVINANTTFIAQYEKENASSTGTSPFVDVQAGTYYESPVQWAVNKGITTGTSATTFGPDSTCTRAQAVTFLWRAAGSPAPKNSEMVFTDVANGSYYYNAVLWAVENGITNGTSATTFSPDNNCTRAQIVTFLWRSQKTPAVDAANPFADVASSQYYTNAVLWAVGNGITNGTSATTFSPDANCTRAQIVTFLYRCLADEK